MGPWSLLLLAGLCEVVWAIGLKYTRGLTRPGPTLITLFAYLGSFVLLAQALKLIPLSIGYAAWVAIGVIGTVIAGITMFNEKLSAVQILCLVFIAGGVVGLKLATPAVPAAAPPSTPLP